MREENRKVVSVGEEWVWTCKLVISYETTVLSCRLTPCVDEACHMFTIWTSGSRWRLHRNGSFLSVRKSCLFSCVDNISHEWVTSLKVISQTSSRNRTSCTHVHWIKVCSVLFSNQTLKMLRTLRRPVKSFAPPELGLYPPFSSIAIQAHTGRKKNHFSLWFLEKSKTPALNGHIWQSKVRKNWPFILPQTAKSFMNTFRVHSEQKPFSGLRAEINNWQNRSGIQALRNTMDCEEHSHRWSACLVSKMELSISNNIHSVLFSK